MLGVMIDCSRNAVMSVPALKSYAALLAEMGYDTLMLYTEDTYEVEGEPYFGYLRGRYSMQELRELDDHCASLGIELVPCIQTLAHLNALFQASEVYDEIRDCDDILLIDHPRTYALIDRMLSTLSSCIRSRKIHIGMDEAPKVGLGKYLSRHGYTDRFDLINRHLHKVCALADKYGYRPMVWSDMFCRLAMNTANYYDHSALEELRGRACLPQNISLVYWDYYSTDEAHYTENISVNRLFDRPILFAGGAWTWRGFMPDNSYSMEITAAAMRACRASGMRDVFITLWGDDGAECSKLAILPSLLFAAEAFRGNTDLPSIKRKFRELTNCDWDAFLLPEMLDRPVGGHRGNPSKYLLYNDVFSGLNDYRVRCEDAEHYRALSARFASLTDAEIAPAYRYIFETAESLCNLLARKATLGIRTRQAYREKDTETLRRLAMEDYPAAAALTEQFLRIFFRQWEKENKPFGFDIQELRLGGLSMRLRHCAERLLAYLAGEAERIPELEESLLPGAREHYVGMSTPHVITQIDF